MKISTKATLVIFAATPFIITCSQGKRLGGGPVNQNRKKHGVHAITSNGTNYDNTREKGDVVGHPLIATKDEDAGGNDDEPYVNDVDKFDGNGVYDPDGIAQAVEKQMDKDWEDIMGYSLEPTTAPAEPSSDDLNNTEKMKNATTDSHGRHLRSCQNNHNNCQYWASIGECSKNPGYMLSNCKKSCGQCSSSHCSDNNKNCQYWASIGECSKNPGYMLSQCKRSCSQCSSSGTNSAGREQQWLDAHNKRRKKYHSRYAKSYVPLKWSKSVAASARNYANKLIRLSGCQIRHRYQGDIYGGENLAAHYSSNTQTPDSILQRWAENEENKHGRPFNEWGHFTQVIWRGTKYVGCGEASKSGCSIQVCRYIAPGNCGVGSGSLRSAINKAMHHSSACNPQCPAEGCF